MAVESNGPVRVSRYTVRKTQQPGNFTCRTSLQKNPRSWFDPTPACGLTRN